jgi:hypothetical protein
LIFTMAAAWLRQPALTDAPERTIAKVVEVVAASATVAPTVTRQRAEAAMAMERTVRFMANLLECVGG